MKKFIALFLVFSLLALYGNLYAKKKGAELVIQKKDGQESRGELIDVKENSLLLKESESGFDVSIDIGDVTVITVVKKSKIALGSGIGLLTGLGIGFLAPLGLNIAFQKAPRSSQLELSYKYALGLGAIGMLIGGIYGIRAETDEIIQFKSKSPEEIQKILEKLRSKARIPDYQ